MARRIKNDGEPRCSIRAMNGNNYIPKTRQGLETLKGEDPGMGKDGL